jgi:hypothetical protein
MSTKRFKTEKEFIEEFGKDWRNDLPIFWNPRMDLCLGEPYSGKLNNVTLPRVIDDFQGTWTLCNEVLT